MNIADCPVLKSECGRCRGQWLVAYSRDLNFLANALVIHVLPNFGREHVKGPTCWCGPRYDDSRDDGLRILVHECDN